MNQKTLVTKAFQFSALSVALALTACGGGSGNDGAEADSGLTVRGVMVAPQSRTESSTAAMVAKAQLKNGSAFGSVLSAETASITCATVPDGYEPLSAVVIQVLDQGGTSLGEFSTDECGSFSERVSDTAFTLSASLPDGKIVERAVEKFNGTEPYIVSSLPADAELVISILQNLGAAKLAITVTDSLTGKAVLGLAEENFSFNLDTTPLTVESINYGALTAQSASLSVVLDGSGSMGSEIMDPVTGERFAALQVASYATHELLNGLSSGQDEAGIVIFDDDIKVINNTVTESLFGWGDPTGNASTEAYRFSDSGLAVDVNALRPIVDFYNPVSEIYLYGNALDPVHPATGDVRIVSGRYPWGGSTAFYDAMFAGLDLVNQGVNGRKIMVALTDGLDNRSSETMETVINSANNFGIPVFTVAFGSQLNVDEPSMKTIAEQTGGEYQRVEGTDLTGLFEGIQTGIRFQYVVNFEPFAAGVGRLEATVNYGAATVSRSIQFQ